MRMKSNSKMKRKTLFAGHSQQGFSLVEILLGLVIGMFGVLVVLQTMSFSESQKRTTTSGGDAQTTGMVALMMMERDVMSAGFGAPDIECSEIKFFNKIFTPQIGELSGRPVSIDFDNPSAGTDQLTILRGNSALGSIPASIVNAMPKPSSVLTVNYGDEFQENDMILLSEPTDPTKTCALAELTQPSKDTKNGAQWNLIHNSNAANSVWNDSTNSIFPTGGYAAGAKVLNMGQMENIQFYVENGNLMRKDKLRLAVANINPSIVANGVVALKALYGRDTDGNGYADTYDTTAPSSNKEVVSVRIGILVQSVQYVKEMVSPISVVLWKDGTVNGPIINLSNEQRHYRYRTYETIIPIRNIIWNN